MWRGGLGLGQPACPWGGDLKTEVGVARKDQPCEDLEVGVSGTGHSKCQGPEACG